MGSLVDGVFGRPVWAGYLLYLSLSIHLVQINFLSQWAILFPSVTMSPINCRGPSSGAKDCLFVDQKNIGWWFYSALHKYHKDDEIYFRYEFRRNIRVIFSSTCIIKYLPNHGDSIITTRRRRAPSSNRRQPRRPRWQPPSKNEWM